MKRERSPEKIGPIRQMGITTYLLYLRNTTTTLATCDVISIRTQPTVETYSAKYMSKWLKNEQKCPKMPNIQHLLTVFDSIQFDRILVPNNITNAEYFQILFLSQIFCPSLEQCW